MPANNYKQLINILDAFVRCVVASAVAIQCRSADVTVTSPLIFVLLSPRHKWSQQATIVGTHRGLNNFQRTNIRVIRIFNSVEAF